MTKHMVRRHWEIQKLIIFIQLIIFPVSAGLICNRRNWTTITASQICNISIDVFGMLILIILFLNCTKDKNDLAFRTGCFTYLITANSWGFFLDAMCWCCDGIEKYAPVSLFANTGYYLSALAAMMLFWHYLVEVSESENPKLRILTIVLNIACLFSIFALFGNLFGRYYFNINEQGKYIRGPYFYCSQLFFCIMLVCFVILITRMQITGGKKAALLSVVAAPFVTSVLQTIVYGTSFTYAGLMLSLLIIYGKVFSEQSRELAEKKMQVLQREKEILTEKQQRQRIETELELAANIQNNLIPQKFPAFPERKEFFLFGEVHPAREVGGDFYDFFFVDEDHLVLVMADVSGKGIPAALYMMAAKTMLNDAVRHNKSPGEVLGFVNEQLCEKSDEVNMFVTVWLGIVEISTGKVITANGGHEYPIIGRKNGSFEVLKDKHGLVLGAMKDVHYKETEFVLEPGDTLFVYTDGVTEATSDLQELYGIDRTLRSLNRFGRLPLEGLHQGIKEDIDQFVGDADQFDDLTMLSLRRAEG